MKREEKQSLKYVLHNEEVTFYDKYREREFTSRTLVNFIRLYKFIPDQVRVNRGEETMAKSKKDVKPSAKEVKTKGAKTVKAPATKAATKPKSK